MPERDLFDEIARIAYELWERDGCIHGRDIEHWCQAEHIVISRIQPVGEEKPKKVRSAKKTPAKAAPKAAGKITKTKRPSRSATKA
jgi:hypothetical protein